MNDEDFEESLRLWRDYVMRDWDELPQFVKNNLLIHTPEVLRTGKVPDPGGRMLTPDQLAIYQEIVDFARSKGVMQ